MKRCLIMILIFIVIGFAIFNIYVFFQGNAIKKQSAIIYAKYYIHEKYGDNIQFLHATGNKYSIGKKI